MKAIAALGPSAAHPEGLLLDTTLSFPPLPGPRDLRVRVEAIAVNPVDLKVRATLPGEGPGRVLGWDAAGVVEAVGDGVERFRVGEAVIFAGALRRPGCQAQSVLVDERLAGRMPANVSFAEAAALPLAGLTAWEALFEQLGLDAEGGDQGRTLLILGAAGGVGSMMIQLARRAGLRVIASASRPQSQDWVRRLGAEAVVDHSQPIGPQLDALGHATVDAIANLHDTDAYWTLMAERIRPRGSIVALVSSQGPLDLNPLKSKSARFCWEYMFTRSEHQTLDLAVQGQILDRLADGVEAGSLISTAHTRLQPISATFLEQAYALLQEGHALGKIVLSDWA
ncbi:MAG: zinc-binding alcohol dehydrogenase family protein [Cyanobacteria bacterium K_Offshore_surface_m2_239]|nr:zinc-binding alcohol dehydrogenase family protein [Cyanobacteria bacterium K_Offshore_surface_m2_239]